MKIDRLFEIVYLLMDRKCLTARELAEHFEVSRRTILRDLETLAAAKIPVYTTQGRGGGISLVDGFVLNKTTLTEEEQKQILFALGSLPAAQYGEAKNVLSKLGALFQKSEADWIEVDFSRWGQGQKDNLRFNLLKRAILGRVIVRFEYVSSYGQNSFREVCPLKLIFKSRAWYAQCFCLARRDYRTFRLNRMLGLELTGKIFVGEHFTPPPLDSAEAPLASLVLLELEFPPQVAYRVYDEFDGESIDRNDDGSLHVLTRLPEDDWLYGFLMSFGDRVRVVKPRRIREIVQKRLGLK